MNWLINHYNIISNMVHIYELDHIAQIMELQFCHEPKLKGYMNIQISYYTMIIIKNNNIIIYYNSDIFDNIK